MKTLLFAALLAGPMVYPDSPSFPSNEDLRHFRSLNDPRLSPDGRSVLIRLIDATADGAKPMNGGQAKAFDLKVMPPADESKLPNALPPSPADKTKTASSQSPTLYYTSDLQQSARALKTPSLSPANDRTVASKRIEWKSDKFTIEGLLSRSASFEPKNKLIVEVHGGPLGAYVDNYEPFVAFLVGHGWAGAIIATSSPEWITS